MDNEWIVWVMDWHWGWQVFWGMVVLGLIGSIVDWVRLPVDDKVVLLKVWGINCLTWIIGLATSCIQLATILAFVYFVWYVFQLSQSS